MALKRYAGFIDIHVHLREPGATQKEDFVTGSRAAVAGGFTFIVDMPNNPIPTVGIGRLKEKIALSQKAICNIGFHYGTNGLNTNSFPAAWKNPRVFGLKLYCNHTTGEMLVEDLAILEKIFAAWKSDKPILVHAEGMQLAGNIALAHFYKRRLHVCHIAQTSEVMLIRQAKKKKIGITAGVTPHHLFLTAKHIKKLGTFALAKPAMNPDKHQQALWEALEDGMIDIIETDHAPHTKKEKQSDKPPAGMPGLETAAGLLFDAVHRKKLKEKDIIRLLYDTPKKIFHIPNQKNTYIELDPQKEYRIGKDGYQTKCGWSAFDGFSACGKVETVVIRGKRVL